VIMPPIGLLTGGVDFSRLKWILRPENPDTEAVELVAVQYGAFINTVIQFVIVAWAVFLLVKLVNSIRRKEAEKPPEAQPAPSPTEVLLMEIRDQLKAQNGAGSKTPPTP
jgi:large conductance mechanosensitive channel